MYAKVWLDWLVGTLQILAKNSIRLDHLARQVTEGDFDTFDFILAMDVGFSLSPLPYSTAWEESLLTALKERQSP